jgi:hypothetical protein
VKGNKVIVAFRIKVVEAKESLWHESPNNSYNFYLKKHRMKQGELITPWK